MKILEFIKKELSGWGKYEKILFPLTILFIILISISLKDSKVALISAICGITYSILAGKGKISCYFFGLIGTFCYSFISYKNALFGQLGLYLCYYAPMQILGIFRWKKHLNPESSEIIKTKLTTKESVIYSITAVLLSIILYFILVYFNDKSPIIDAITSIFSIFGLILTVKRCLEQWYIWLLVNTLSVIMWIKAYIAGANCFATILMWSVYTILSVYFLRVWNKEISKQISTED